MTDPYVAGAILIVSFSLFLTFIAGTMRIVEKRRERAREANRQRFWQLVGQDEELMRSALKDIEYGRVRRFDDILEALQDEHRFIGETGPKGKVQ